MHVSAVGVALPANRVDQAEISRLLGGAWTDAGRNPAAVARVHESTGVEQRHLCLPLAAYGTARSFGDTNDAFIEIATSLGEAAIRSALGRADLRACDVDALVLASTTGIAAPSLDAHLMNRLGFRSNLRRVPIVGLGCAAGAAGLARTAELLDGIRGHIALLVCVELCSLTFQLGDASPANVVATGLFGDAAACAVLVRSRRPAASRPEVIDARSMFLPNTESVLGFHIGDSGFKVVLDRELPEVAGRAVPHEIVEILRSHGLEPADVGAWIVHPGGPKILRAIEDALGLAPTALRRSWDTLRRIGNVSSAAVLSILGDVLASPPAPGTYGLMLGMGPGFSAEVVLLRWS